MFNFLMDLGFGKKAEGEMAAIRRAQVTATKFPPLLKSKASEAEA
jgi:hypothetical protein